MDVKRARGLQMRPGLPHFREALMEPLLERLRHVPALAFQETLDGQPHFAEPFRRSRHSSKAPQLELVGTLMEARRTCRRDNPAKRRG